MLGRHRDSFPGSEWAQHGRIERRKSDFPPDKISGL
jgi:hypothetical protein